MKLVRFFNWTDRDFTWSWNSEPYTFRAGESLTLEDWKAEHFAGHLVDRELHREGLQVCDPKREDYMKRTLISTDVVVESEEKAKDAILNIKGDSIGSSLRPVNSPKRGRKPNAPAVEDGNSEGQE